MAEDATEGKFHRNHAQLGFALKDQRTPDYCKAKEALTTAIKRRGPWNTEGWVIYEYNRAICTIKLDPKFNREPESASDTETKAEILADLKAAASLEWIRGLIVEEPSVTKWMSINGVDLKDL